MSQYHKIPAGATGRIVTVEVWDASSSVGAKLAGLAYNTAALTAHYNRVGAAGEATAITLVSATKGTWTSGGFVAVDGTNMPGIYELGIPDAALAAGAKAVDVVIKGAADMVPVTLHIELDAAMAADGSKVNDPAGTTTLLSRIAAALTITGGKVDVNDKTGFSGTATNMRGTDGANTLAPDNASAQAAAASAASADGKLTAERLALIDGVMQTDDYTEPPTDYAKPGDTMVPSVVTPATDVSELATKAEVLALTPVQAAPDLSALEAAAAAIQERTDNLPDDPAGEASLAATHGAGAWTAGPDTGAIAWPYDVLLDTDGDGDPDVPNVGIEGVLVVVTTDLAGINRVGQGYTDSLGRVVFHLDDLGMDPQTGEPLPHYFWRRKGGYAFEDPDIEVVS